MKALLQILTLLILTANVVNGQTMEKTLQKLTDNKLIEQKQVKDFEELLIKSETKSNATYLYSLFQIEFKKLTGHFYSEIGTHLSFGDDVSSPKSGPLRIRDYSLT